jgi:hypothetical protein
MTVVTVVRTGRVSSGENCDSGDSGGSCDSGGSGASSMVSDDR